MPTPTIIKGEEHFFTTIYFGNSGGQRVGRFIPFTDQATIANSCIFNSADSAKLERTPSSNGNRKTFTVSAWIKRGALGTEQHICSSWDGSSNDNNSMWEFRFLAANTISISRYTNNILITNRTFEDTSKFYHVLMAVDTTQGTASNRVKLYVDGDEITSFGTDNRSSVAQDFDTAFNNTADACVVGNRKSESKYFNGYMAEVNLVDGQALLPASFGITDTSTGRWIPKAVEPYPTTTTNIAVTVVDSGGNKFAIDGVTQDTITFIEGATYVFSYPSAHPFALSTTNGGIHSGGSEYVTGVTRDTSANTLSYVVPASAPQLYYYCTNHSGMGGIANTQSAYGVNGFRLTFSDSSNLGADSSGNSNSLTATNLASTDQTTDSPNQNHATFGSNRTANSPTLSEGNLSITAPSSNYGKASIEKIFNSNISSGLYWEYTDGSTNGFEGGIIKSSKGKPQTSEGETDGVILQRRGSGGGNTYWIKKNDSDYADTSVSHSSGDKIGIAVKDNKIWFAVNNTWVLSGDPTNGTNPASTLDDTSYMAMLGCYGSTTVSANFGQKSFSYTPPTGFLALQQDNLPETDKGVSGLTWTKNRDGSDWHYLVDSSRGNTKVLNSNSNAIEETHQDGVQKFLKGGISIEDRDNVNKSGNSFVNWTWVANAGTTSTNTDGSLTSTVQVNQTSGFSIVQGKYFDGTLGHGLSQTPEWIIYKETSPNVNSWFVYHKDLPSSNYYLWLNSTQAQLNYGSTLFAPTSTTFATNLATVSNRDAVAYCWHGVEGFSKFGSYTGNGNSNGTFIYTGFKPSWLMIKSSSHAVSWYIFDNKRNPINPAGKRLIADGNNAEDAGTTEAFDFLSNGFKLRNTSNGTNGSGRTYIYMAFAEHPFIGDGVSPVTAR